MISVTWEYKLATFNISTKHLMKNILFYNVGINIQSRGCGHSCLFGIFSIPFWNQLLMRQILYCGNGFHTWVLCILYWICAHQICQWYHQIICLTWITLINIDIPYKGITKCGWKYAINAIIHEYAYHRSPVNSPHKGQWRGALMFSLICVWLNVWVNHREAGDLRHYRAHNDVSVMLHQDQNGPHIAENIFIEPYHNISSANGFTQNMWKTITWSNVDPVHWRIIASPRPNELNAIFVC